MHCLLRAVLQAQGRWQRFPSGLALSALFVRCLKMWGLGLSGVLWGPTCLLRLAGAGGLVAGGRSCWRCTTDRWCGSRLWQAVWRQAVSAAVVFGCVAAWSSVQGRRQRLSEELLNLHELRLNQSLFCSGAWTQAKVGPQL